MDSTGKTTMIIVLQSAGQKTAVALHSWVSVTLSLTGYRNRCKIPFAGKFAGNSYDLLPHKSAISMPVLTGNQYAAGNAGGRPAKYKREYARLAHRLCLLGHTDAGLAFFFDVNERTINRWKQQHIEFSESVTRGKAIADAEVALSLYRLATGYTYQAEKLFHYKGLVIRAPITVVVPPNVQVAIYWLRMRQPDKWGGRQQQTIDRSGHTRVSRNTAGDIVIDEQYKPALPMG